MTFLYDANLNYDAPFIYDATRESGFVLPDATTLTEIAAHAKRHRYAPAVKVSERWKPMSEEHALDLIRQAMEAGYDVGRPRDARNRR